MAVIASHRVRAKRGPMTGSAKQSRAARGTLDCFVASLLAMTTEDYSSITVRTPGSNSLSRAIEPSGVTTDIDRAAALAADDKADHVTRQRLDARGTMARRRRRHVEC